MRRWRPASPITIFDALEDRDIWGGREWFKDPTTWRPWFTVLRTLFGLPLDEQDLALYRRCTSREYPPEGGTRELWLCVGRRGGKSRILALVACFLAVYRDWRPYLSPGEIPTIKVIAVDRRQARVIYNYAAAFLNVGALAHLVIRDTGDELELSTGVVIEVQTANFRSVRGYTIIACLADEIAFWRSDESANPDSEILGALRPAMTTIPTSLLLCASSPYARRGELWEHYRRYYGQDNPRVLVWHADTLTMNPTAPADLIQQAYENDPAQAEAEYGAQFRSDVEAFVAREVVDNCVSLGIYERAPIPFIRYTAFVDPSGGSGDSFTLAIGHEENDRAIIDCLREVRPPFSPESVVKEFADLCQHYNIHEVTGDRYGGVWPQERFAQHSIHYNVAEKTKSEFYVELLPLLNSQRVQLLDHQRAISQLCSLERRTGRGTGRDIIDHPPKSHDDLANVIAGVATRLIGGDVQWREIVQYLIGTEAAE